MALQIQAIKRSIMIALLIGSSLVNGQRAPISVTLQCEHYSQKQGGYFSATPPLKKPSGIDGSGNYVEFLGNGNWLRFDSVNLMAGQFDSLRFRYAGYWGHDANLGHKAHFKLDSLKGTDLLTIDLAGGWFQFHPDRFPLSTKVTGTHTIYLTFEGGDTVCQLADYFTFMGTCTVNPSEAQTYYVGNYGSDNNDGKNVENAFKTIQKAANVMKPGSICYIRQGIYRETVRPMYAGTAAFPLTFQNYGNELVYIDGADSVKGWTQYSGNIYKATMPWSLGKYKNQLMVDGKSCVVARSPNIDDPNTPNPPWVNVYPYGLYNWVHRQNEFSPFMIPTMVYMWGNTDATLESQGFFKWGITEYNPPKMFPS